MHHTYRYRRLCIDDAQYVVLLLNHIHINIHIHIRIRHILHKCIGILMYYIVVHIHIYICRYIVRGGRERERERERERNREREREIVCVCV